MGATNNIKETDISSQIVGCFCFQCQQKFTKAEINESNFDIYWDTSNNVNLQPLAKGYQLSILIRSIEHNICPEIPEPKQLNPMNQATKPKKTPCAKHTRLNKHGWLVVNHSEGECNPQNTPNYEPNKNH